MSDRVRTDVVRRPRAGQVLVRQHAVGPAPRPRGNQRPVSPHAASHPAQRLAAPRPVRVGAAGVVEAVGDGVVGFVAGDRVAYSSEPGRTTDAQVMSADKLIGIPPRVSDQQAAALLGPGLAARILVKETYPVGRGESVLVQDAVAGIGAMVLAWAKALGATVIATVGSPGRDLARRLGADHVIVLGEEDVTARVREFTRGIGVDVVYDGGTSTLPDSAACARRGGVVVAYGDPSRSVPALTGALSARAVRLIRPMAARKAHAGTLQLAAADVFLAIRDGVFRELPITGHEQPVVELPEAGRLAA